MGKLHLNLLRMKWFQALCCHSHLYLQFHGLFNKKIIACFFVYQPGFPLDMISENCPFFLILFPWHCKLQRSSGRNIEHNTNATVFLTQRQALHQQLNRSSYYTVKQPICLQYSPQSLLPLEAGKTHAILLKNPPCHCFKYFFSSTNFSYDLMAINLYCKLLRLFLTIWLFVLLVLPLLLCEEDVPSFWQISITQMMKHTSQNKFSFRFESSLKV